MALAIVLLVALLAPSCSSRLRPRVGADVAAETGAVQRGLASWYGEEFADLPTASGEIFRPEAVSAAHRTLPLGTVVEVTNEKNGRTLRVRINDRGPFVAGRILDLSRGAAKELGSVVDGVVPITLEVVTLGTNERIRPQAATPPGGWLVQAGAFASEENAIALRERLKSRYPNPYLEEFQGLRRVKFGPYATRAEAEAARDTLAELGLAGVVAR